MGSGIKTKDTAKIMARVKSRHEARTKDELIGELAEARSQLAGLREAEARHRHDIDSMIESVKLFRSIAGDSVDAVICGDHRGVITYWNQASEKLFGYKAGEITGKPVATIIPVRFRRAHREGMRRVLETGEARVIGKTVGLTGLRKDGGEFPIELSLSKAEAREGPVFTAIVRDASERQRAEAQIHTTRAFLEKVLDSVIDAIFVVDNNRIFSDCNAAVEKIFGYKKEELVGKSAEIVYPDRRAFEEIGGSFRHEIRKRGYFESEIQLRRKDGSLFPARFSASLLVGGGEGPAGMVVVVRDISRLKQAEEEFRRVSRQNKMILDSAGEGIYGLDLKGRVTFVNPAAAAMCGYKAEEIIGNSGHETWHHSRADGSAYPAKECPIYSAYKDGTTNRRDDEVFWRKDGSSFPVEYVSTPIREDDVLSGAVVTFNDVTEQKTAETELRGLNRALKVLSQCNQALVRVEHESDLLNDICRIIVEDGGYRFAWIGFAEQDAGKTVRPVAVAGEGREFLEALKISWAEGKHGRVPAGIAIRTGKPVIENRIFENRKTEKWCEEASRRGFAVYIALPLLSNAHTIGALSICSEDPGIFKENEVDLLSELANDLAFGIETLRMRKAREHAEAELEKTLEHLRKAIEGVAGALAVAAEARDPYIAGHQKRVSDLAVALAEEMKLSQDKVDGLRLAGMLHDVGKISVPAEILTKPGKITDLEFDMIKSHSQVGYDILKEVEFPWPVARIARQHHEKLDGSGYPDGAREDEIIKEAKILCVADVMEAMSSHRPYRPALGIDAALKELKAKKGILYDPEAVDACIRLFKKKGFEF